MTSSGCRGHIATSEADFEWDGYTAAVWRSRSTRPQRCRRGVLGPYEALALLHRAHRGGGNEPLEHTVTGPLASALGFDLPWVITSMPRPRG